MLLHFGPTIMRLAIVVASAFVLLSTSVVEGQAPVGAANAAGASGEIHGRVADSTTNQPVAVGSITIRKQSDTAFAGGALPKADGTFRVDGLAPGRYTLRFRALGFAPVTRKDLIITQDKPVLDIGTLNLTTVATKLAGQEIKAQRDEEVLSPDRNSYSTKNMTTAAGGTAVDVLRNIPLVEVDQNNNVSLRNNSNVVVQINGRSTPLKGDQLGLFLSQLPASNIKTVEVATNPSAKDDPEGTAGIINIILKQDVELGLSGGLNAAAGTTGQRNVSANIGKQQGKFTGFFQASGNHDQRTFWGTISRTNLGVPTPAFVETDLEGEGHFFNTGGSVRSEYRLNETNALTFDAWVYGGHPMNDNASYYTNLDQSRTVTGAFNQFNASSFRWQSQDYDLAFHSQGKPNTPQLTAEMEYAINNNKSTNDLSGVIVRADASTPAFIPSERDRNVGHNPYLNAKLDYSRPINPNTKIETGFKATHRIQKNDFTASYLNSAGDFEVNPARTTGIDYLENIVGAYGLLSQRIQKVQLQTGLRLEDANTHFTTPSLSKTFDKEYWSAYPSFVFSYNFTDLRQVKLSYSRRVSRPDPFQLNPVEFRLDNRHVFRGNPNLAAEYANAYELALQEGRSWGSIQLNSYVRTSDHAVRNIQFVDSTGVSVSTFENVASTLSVGSDLSVNVRKGPLQLNTTGSLSRYSSDASNLSRNLSTHDIVKSARINATWVFSPVFDAQITGNYRAPVKTEGGSQLAFAVLNASARYKMWGDKGNISLRISDPFKFQKFGFRTANGTVLLVGSRSLPHDHQKFWTGAQDQAEVGSGYAAAGTTEWMTHGSANATYASPDFVPSFPPPAAITTYCFPLTANVLGVA
jgi:outer membrane receptor protein involved in Fe transport